MDIIGKTGLQNNLMTLGSRISEARDRAGKTQQEVADHFGITREAVSQWESDDTRPRSAKLSELTRFLGVHPAWLLDGSGPMSGNASLSPESRATVPVVGQIGAGDVMFPHDEYSLGQGVDEVPAPMSVEGGNLVAVRIKGDSMRPMKEGWLMFFRKTHSGVPAECRDQLCVVKIANDGPIMVKELRWTNKRYRYNLLSWNAETIEDVALDWAAKVMDIRPR